MLTLRKERNFLIYFCINVNWNLLIRKLPITGTQITQVALISYWQTVPVAFSIQKPILQGYQCVTNWSYLFLKQHFKTGPKGAIYRDFKSFDQEIFNQELRTSLSSETLHGHTIFEENFLVVLNRYAPLKVH